MLKLFFPLLLLLLFSSTSAPADWAFKSQAGLGYTNNANYEETQENSDLYWLLRQTASLHQEDRSWRMWLSYKSYSAETHNNVFSWRSSLSNPVVTEELGLLDFDLAASGQHYTNNSPNTTEDSFDYLAIDAALSKAESLQKNLEMTLEGGYQLKSYLHFDGRTDHTIFFNASWDWKYSARRCLSPFAELGLIFSNDELYRRNYLDLGTEWILGLTKSLQARSLASLRISAFPERTVSQETRVSRRRGILRQTSRDENETQTSVQLSGSLVKLWNARELSATLYLNNQNTNSGFADYTEAGIIFSAAMTF